MSCRLKVLFSWRHRAAAACGGKHDGGIDVERAAKSNRGGWRRLATTAAARRRHFWPGKVTRRQITAGWYWRSIADAIL